MNLFFFKEQLKREKIELENTLEKEQESLVNRLWKRMEKLETDKRLLQQKLEQPDQSHSVTFIFSSYKKNSLYIFKKGMSSIVIYRFIIIKCK